jgi:hypothetical protein
MDAPDWERKKRKKTNKNTGTSGLKTTKQQMFINVMQNTTQY